MFFIDISGGMELRLADLFDEPVLEIRGKVSLEFGNRTLRDGSTKFRMKLEASGTIKVIKLGNLASGAASFVLETGDGLEDLEFWGVASFATNFSFLEQYGVFMQGSALLQINTTSREQKETISLEGIPGGTIFVDLRHRRARAAERHVHLQRRSIRAGSTCSRRSRPTATSTARPTAARPT